MRLGPFIDMTSYETIVECQWQWVASDESKNICPVKPCSPCSPVGLLPGPRMPAIFQIDDCAWRRWETHDQRESIDEIWIYHISYIYIYIYIIYII